MGKCRPSDPAECHACCGTLAAAYGIPVSNQTQPGGLFSGGVPNQLFGEAARSTTFFAKLDRKVTTETRHRKQCPWNPQHNTTEPPPRETLFISPSILRRLSLPGLVDDPHIFGILFSLPAMQDEIRARTAGSVFDNGLPDGGEEFQITRTNG